MSVGLYDVCELALDNRADHSCWMQLCIAFFARARCNHRMDAADFLVNKNINKWKKNAERKRGRVQINMHSHRWQPRSAQTLFIILLSRFHPAIADDVHIHTSHTNKHYLAMVYVVMFRWYISIFCLIRKRTITKPRLLVHFVFILPSWTLHAHAVNVLQVCVCVCVRRIIAWRHKNCASPKCRR